MTKNHSDLQNSGEARKNLRRCVPDGAAPQPGTPPGSVQHDTRGNAFWNWDVATGVLAGTKAIELLQLLDNPTLQLAGECDFATAWAGDPYNRG